MTQPAARTTAPRAIARLALAASIALVLVATVGPFGAIDGTIPPRWCVACGGAWLTDGISNVVLFLPFGLALAACGARSARVVLGAMLLSSLVEAMQSVGIPPARSPAIADILANTIGGVIGAALWEQRTTLLTPTHSEARWLAGAWSALATLIIVLSAMAVRAVPGPPPAALRYQLSRFDYSPGFGWYGGRVQVATVNGVPFAHRGTGPVVVQADTMPASLAVSAVVSGRDPVAYRRVMVFVHTPGDTTAIAMLAQRGDRAEWLVRRQAAMWGLALPIVSLPDAFTGRTRTDTSVLTLAALANDAELTLEAWDAARPQRRIDEGDRVGADVRRADNPNVSLRLTPLLGWSLIQTIAHPFDRLAPLWLACWLLLLVTPIAYFVARSGQLVSGAPALLAPPLTVALLPSVWHGASASQPEWLLLAMMMVAGFLAGRATVPDAGVSFPT